MKIYFENTKENISFRKGSLIFYDNNIPTYNKGFGIIIEIKKDIIVYWLNSKKTTQPSISYLFSHNGGRCKVLSF